MRTSTLGLGIAIITVALSTRTALAVSPQCYATTTDTSQWFPAKSVISVKMNNVGANSALGATGFSQADMADAIKRAVNIWNEQSGDAFKLRYAGTTTAINETSTIIIVGNPTACGGPKFGQEADTVFGFTGWIVKEWSWSRITLYRFNGGLGCPMTPWVLYPADPSDTTADDVVRVLVHELGHAAFNIGHPDDADYSTCNYGIPIASTMVSGGTRELTPWDLEIAQQRYGVRAQYSSFFRTRMATPTSWQPAFVAASTSGTTPLFRMGSMGQRNQVRPFGWVDNNGSAVRTGGAGYQYSVSQYWFNQFWSWYSMGPSLGKPVAFAAKPSSAAGTNPPVEFVVAYLKYVGSNMYSDPTGEVCWRNSTNGGSTWSLENCLPGEMTDGYGLTATYDPLSDYFIVAYTHDFQTHTQMQNINLVVFPSGYDPSNPNPLKPVRTHSTSILALHPPSIACTGAPTRCLMAYEDLYGYLNGAFINISIAGNLSFGSTINWGYRAWDTPGLVYLPDDDTFRFAITDSNNAIFTYKAANSAIGTLQGTGDAWNSANSQVSTAVLTTRTIFGANRVEAWFLKYF